MAHDDAGSQRKGGLCRHLKPLLERAQAHDDPLSLGWWDSSCRWYRVVLDGASDPQAARGAEALPDGIEVVETPELVRFACTTCRHSLDLPRPIPLPDFEEQELSPDLLPAFRLEIELGNRLVTVSRREGRLELTLSGPLHLDTIAERLQLPANVERWECWDSHYSIQAGLSCTRTGHVLAGPPPLIGQLRPLLEPVVRSLVAGAYEDLEALCRAGVVTPEALRRTVEEHGQRLMAPPPHAYQLQTGSGADSLLVGPIPDRRPPAWLVSLTLWTEESGRGELVLVLTVEAVGDLLRATIEDLGDNPLPAMKRVRGRSPTRQDMRMGD